VIELSGGFEGWKSHGLPTETGETAHDEPVERARAFLDETRRAAREEQAKQAAKKEGTAAEEASEKGTSENSPAGNEEAKNRASDVASDPNADEREPREDEAIDARDRAPSDEGDDERPSPAAKRPGRSPTWRGRSVTGLPRNSTSDAEPSRARPGAMNGAVLARRDLRERGAAMPEKKTIEKAREDKAQGKAPTTQAGEFVREEIHHVREGKHGARSTKQAIAIGLSKARRAGVVPRRGRRSRARRDP
jgi:hypothetical protein